MAEREAILLETEPDRPLKDVVARLVDPETGEYHLPADEFFDGVARMRKQTGASGLGEIVAVVDTGVDESHPLLRASVVASMDFTDEATTEDLHGHGTVVALLIRRVAPRTKFLNAKAFNKRGRARESALAAALEWAGKAGATVVNVSGGIPSPDPIPPWLAHILSPRGRTDSLVYYIRCRKLRNCAVCQAADRLKREQVVLVCVAVGNSRKYITCPACSRAVMVVGAIEGAPARVPEYQSLYPDIVAPALYLAEGTSFSTPLASAAQALLREAANLYNNIELLDIGKGWNRANLLFEKGHLEDAIALYTRALRNDPHTKSHITEGTPVEECRLCQAAVYPARMRLGMAYLQLDDCEHARKQFELNVQIAPSFPDGYMNLGAAERCLGRFEAAVHSYSKALHLDSSKPEAYDGLADTYAFQGRIEEAIAAFERSVRLNSHRSYPYLRLAELCRAAGREEDMKRYQDISISCKVAE